MNKKALKEFAIYARNELRSQIALRAQAFGITPKGSPVLVSGADYVEINNKKYPLTYKKGLQKLLNEIETKGYDNVIEEVSYTWFNRLLAIRYMEVHNYLPSRIRVLSSETKGKVDPDVLTEYQYTDLPVNKDEIASLLGYGNREEAFRKLLIAQCNELSEIMPFLFEKIEDFTELLLPESLLYADSLINKLGKELEDENFQHVEVIGWLYQYYISEKKDEVFAGLKKNKKITKENIPAATQLFTPHWIVRYMVENSLGHLWLESHSESDLKKEMKYYVEPVEQEKGVQAKLEELRNPNLSPEEITILDPACGSGHILVYAFDLLYRIYEERGYPAKEIPSLILDKNLYGIDIDDRAVQLASFSLLMKAREKTKRIFSTIPQLNIISVQESNGILIEEVADLVGESDTEIAEVRKLLNEFINAKNFGSIIQLEKLNFNKYIENINILNESGEYSLENLEVFDQLNKVKNILIQAKLLANEYDVVITNPPYMGLKGMNQQLKDFVKKRYHDSKFDLFAIFMERCNVFTKKNGFHGEVNQHSWMFLSSFEKLREKIIKNYTILSMVHLGPRTFEEIGGEVVQSTSYIIRNTELSNYSTKFYRLIKYNRPKDKEKAFLENVNVYITKQNSFYVIPGMPIAYWASVNTMEIFKNNPLLFEFSISDGQNVTGDNNKFVKYIWEVENKKIGINKKWLPYAKGGGYRKWFGNITNVINWSIEAREHYRSDPICRIIPEYLWYKKGITWGLISTTSPSFRVLPEGSTFDKGGSSIFIKDEKLYNYIVGVLNSKVAYHFLNYLNSTINYQVKDIRNVPIVIGKNYSDIEESIKDCIKITEDDWNSFEISLGFIKHPFFKDINNGKFKYLYQCFLELEDFSKKQFIQLKHNEQIINNFFIELYKLEDELTSDVLNEDVSIQQADRLTLAKSFLSYCIGLNMGRYSLDVEGLVFAGGEWDGSKYKTFQPDSDGILPLTETEYFEDDVVARLQELLVILFGQDTLVENLRWLAESLTMKANETPVERLRRYFFDEFFADHCKIYQKRPIYWMAESGSKKGFRALFYLHRYTPETLATMRFSYVQNLQEKLRQEQKRLEQDLLIPDITAAMKKRYEKQLTTIKAQQVELIDFDKKLAELANQRIALDLDDGVVVNYAKLQNILAKIK